MGLSWQDRFDRLDGASHCWASTASKRLAACLNRRGDGAFSTSLLDRRAPVVGFDGLFRTLAVPHQGSVPCLGPGIEATALGQATNVPHAKAGDAKDMHEPDASQTPLTLCLRIRAAHDLRSSDAGDILDPYVVVRAGGHQWQTPALTNNRDPVWATDNEFVHAGSAELLVLEVMNANGSRSLGKAVLSTAELGKGVWHRRTLPLDGSGEISIEVRCDALPFEHCEPLKEASKNPTKYADSRGDASETVELMGMVRGTQIRLPQDWADVQELSFGRRTPAPSLISTFEAPGDLFGEARLEVSDPASWLLGLSRLQSTTTQQGNANVYANLARLQERQERQSLLTKRDARGSLEADDAAVQKALSKQKLMNQAAQEQLQKVLKKLQDLEDDAARAREAPGVMASPKPRVGHGSASSSCNTPLPTGLALQPSETAAPVTVASPASEAKPKAIPSNTGPTGPTGSTASMASPSPAAPPASSRSPSKPKPIDFQDRFETAIAVFGKAKQAAAQFEADASRKEMRKQVKMTLRRNITAVSAVWSGIKATTNRVLEFMQVHCQDDASKEYVEFAFADILAGQAMPQVKPWPLAQVACRVFDHYPKAQEMLTGLLCHKSPAVLADFRNQPDLSSEAFDEYVNTAAARLRFLQAIAVTQGDLGMVWHWMSRTVNQPPQPLAVVLLYATLESVGADAQARYKKQFDKLIAHLDAVFLVSVSELSSRLVGKVEHAHVRARWHQLCKWISDFKKTGKAEPPPGRHITVADEATLTENT
ncbi:iksA [Symbiodinium sp. CCMP2592]|nr:iksA [Symbiodinium sp. CCMP2592]